MRRHDFFELPVSQVIRETDNAVSLVFDVPPVLKEIFTYRAGQFLTLRRRVDGKYRHRCYSLCSAPEVDARHKITIKRVDGGLVSNDICSNVRAGMVLLVQPPAGSFVPSSLDQDLLLFAGGSGVTPVLSILKAALLKGTRRIALVYANRDERSVIFRDELIELSVRHPDRLTIINWLESVQGLPTASQLASLARPFAPRETFVCGPEMFMTNVSEALSLLGVPGKRIHVERFVSLPDEDAAKPELADESAADTKLQVLMDGVEHDVVWPASMKMLDAMLAAGLDAPYSCRVGGCSACMCRILSGNVRMIENLILDDREMAEGWVLACQAHPLSSEVRAEIP